MRKPKDRRGRKTTNTGTWILGVLEIRYCSRKLYTANARQEQMTQMQGQHFLKKRHYRIQKSGAFASKWLQLRSERLSNVGLAALDLEAKSFGRQAVQH